MGKPFSKFVAVLAPKRRWTQFSLGTMLLAVTLLCVWLADYVHPIRRLERQLRDPDQEERVIAAQRLGYLGPEARSTVKALLRAAEDGDAEVRRTAVWALSRVSGNPDLVLQFLDDADDDVRKAAGEGFLWAGGDPVQLFSSMLASNHFRGDLYGFCPLLAPNEAADLLPLLLDSLAADDESLQDEMHICLDNLSVPAPSVTPLLIERLGHEHPEIRGAAANLLLLLSTEAREAAPALKAHLHDADPFVSAAMAAALGAIDPQDKEFLDVLKRSLRSDEPALVNRAVEYMWRLGPAAAGAADDLAAALYDPRWRSRQTWAPGRGGDALKRLGPRAISAADRRLRNELAARKCLRALPKDSRAQVQRLAMAAMDLLRCASAQVRGDANGSGVSSHAENGPLGRIRRAVVRLLEEAEERFAATAMPEEKGFSIVYFASAAPPARAVPTLIAALDDELLRDGAVDELGRIGPQAAAAVRPLLPLLDSDDPFFRHKVFEALQQIGARDEAVRARLRHFLASSDLDERYDAARALAASGEPARQIVPALIDLAIDPHFCPHGGELPPGDWFALYAYPALLASIASFGPDAVPELHAALQKRNPQVRRAAVDALGVIGPAAKAAIPLLIELLDDSACRDAAAESLGRMGFEARAAVPRLLALLEAARLQGASEEYVALLDALGAIGPDALSAAPALLNFANFDDSRTRQAAVLALAKIDPADASLTPRLKRLLAEWERKSAFWSDEDHDWSDEEHHKGFVQVADAVWKLGPKAEPLVPDLRRMLAAPSLEEEMRRYAAYALAGIPGRRHEGKRILERLALQDNWFLAELLLERFRTPKGAQTPRRRFIGFGGP